jgi:predicted nuclease with TOPRIM domain
MDVEEPDIANAADLLRPAHADPVQQALQELTDRIDEVTFGNSILASQQTELLAQVMALQDRLGTLENRLRSVEGKLVRAHNHGR